MYAYSHTHQGGWIGSFDTVQQALESGRAAYGADSTIWVGEYQDLRYSDIVLDGPQLLSMMEEQVAIAYGDQAAESFSLLSVGDKGGLTQYIRDAVEEWESELPEGAELVAQKIARFRKFTEHQRAKGNKL